MHVAPSTLALVGVVPLLAWRVYARFRRTVGRQRLSAARPWITLSLFTVLVGVLVRFAAQAHPERLGWLAAGLPAGLLLAVYGLRSTRFEPTPHGLFYTPNAYLGITLSVLFLGRMVLRMVEVFAFTGADAVRPPSFAGSPLTLSVFGLFAGYYMFYAVGLLRWRHRVQKEESAAGGGPSGRQ
ncbi:MAG TPA: hypothetical protein DD490_02810 [Acidobacteria bacterium]|nr:hypothetical protein [Acidobacteriota bacterium]